METSITCDWSGRMEDGRKIAALRGPTRDLLDHLLTHELNGHHFGRSAFILAAVQLVKTMDDDEMNAFIAKAEEYEKELPL